MSSQESLFRQQMAFAAHLRNPERNPAPSDIEDRRMKVYRELFYNNIEGFISGGFPVLRQLIPDDKWHRMIRDFFSCYRCKTPYFLEITEEFLAYLQSRREPEPDDLPFLLELAHYEWVEMAVDTTTSDPLDSVYHEKGDLVLGRPVLSPLALVLCYQYPVHLIGPDFIPADVPAEATYLIVHRNLENKVKFMAINAVTARLLTLLEEDETLTGSNAIQQVAQEIKYPDPEQLVEIGRETLNHLRDTGIILGTTLRTVD